jgi:hypothetical protein
MQTRSALLLVAAATAVTGHISRGRPGYGLIGYGVSMYKPECAYGCRSAIANPLDCPGEAEHEHMAGMDHGSATPSPECYANNEPFLTTLAWCMHLYCDGVEVEDLEKYWRLNVAGRQVEQPVPKWTYQEAMQNISSPPTESVEATDTLNVTALVAKESWEANALTLANFEKAESTHERYG